MIKIVVFTYIFISVIWAQEGIYKISDSVKSRMLRGNSWHHGCPIGLDDLRYLHIPYVGFDHEPHVGEMVVHKDVADEVVHIFDALYTIGYPIHKMKLVSYYKANDWQSIEADNTSAFNCRHATGSKKWSKHSYGKAIDLNSIENPYVSRSGHIAHKASLKYAKRKHKLNTPADKAVLLKHDKATQIFKKYGWKWGGDWHGVKDYQHFYK